MASSQSTTNPFNALRSPTPADSNEEGTGSINSPPSVAATTSEGSADVQPSIPNAVPRFPLGRGEVYVLEDLEFGVRSIRDRDNRLANRYIQCPRREDRASDIIQVTEPATQGPPLPNRNLGSSVIADAYEKIDAIESNLNKISKHFKIAIEGPIHDEPRGKFHNCKSGVS